MSAPNFTDLPNDPNALCAFLTSKGMLDLKRYDKGIADLVADALRRRSGRGPAGKLYQPWWRPLQSNPCLPPHSKAPRR